MGLASLSLATLASFSKKVHRVLIQREGVGSPVHVLFYKLVKVL